MPGRQLARINAQSILQLPGKFTRVSWKVPRDITLDEWIAAMKVLATIEGSVQWWQADGWVAGECREWGNGEELADQMGLKFQTIMNYGSVARAIETSRRREVLTFSHHETVAALPPAQQDRWLERAIREGWTRNKLRAALEQTRAIDRTRQVAFDAGELGRNVVLYADPPWQYENPPMGGSNRSIENHYPTMDLDEICALPVADIAHDNSILFLWATAPKLAECLQVITAWGFTYRTNLVWDKEIIGMGYHVRNQHEILLIGKRGELAPPAPENRPPSIIRARRGEHSEKPDEFAAMIERMYPDVGERQRIELFARTARPGWKCWGNQAPLAEAAE